jgi:cell division protein FtsQ
MFARVSHGQAVIRAEYKWPRFNQQWLGRGMLLLLCGVLAGWLFQHLADPMTLPIHKIRVQGALVHVNEDMLRQSVVDKVQGGYFNIDVAALRKTVEQLPWVRTAAVRRVWPDAVVINVIEQRPLAIWATGGLVNDHGELFKPEESSRPKHLPLFAAPAGMEHNVTELYRDLSAQLAPLELRIVELQLDQRRAAQLQLHNGIELVLGREERLARMQRFVKVYNKTLARHTTQIRRIDMRYSNGMAVQWDNTTTQVKS